MRTLVAVALSSLLLSSAACGGDDDGIDVVGDTPDEAAEEILDATCDRQADCGLWRLDFELDDQGNITSCTPTHLEVDHDTCVADDLADLRDLLECAMPTDEEAEMINDCFNDAIGQGCLSEDEINAYCDALENGEDPDEPGGAPASCDALDPIFEGCGG